MLKLILLLTLTHQVMGDVEADQTECFKKGEKPEYKCIPTGVDLEGLVDWYDGKRLMKCCNPKDEISCGGTKMGGCNKGFCACRDYKEDVKECGKREKGKKPGYYCIPSGGSQTGLVDWYDGESLRFCCNPKEKIRCMQHLLPGCNTGTCACGEEGEEDLEADRKECFKKGEKPEYKCIPSGGSQTGLVDWHNGESLRFCCNPKEKAHCAQTLMARCNTGTCVCGEEGEEGSDEVDCSVILINCSEVIGPHKCCPSTSGGLGGKKGAGEKGTKGFRSGKTGENAKGYRCPWCSGILGRKK